MAEPKPVAFRDLWKGMDQQHRTAAATAFWDVADKASQVQALALLERQLHFRRTSLIKMPPERKAAMLANYAAGNELVAGSMIRTYFFANYRPMLVKFLDALGVPHENGAYDRSNFPQPPSADDLRRAADTIRAEFDPVIVDLYLAALLIDDADLWQHLPEARDSAAQGIGVPPDAPIT